MDNLLLVLILCLNVFISIWNCYVVGTAWKDTMFAGSGFDKALLWSGAIQSGVGFSMPLLLFLAWAISAYLTSGEEPYLSVAEAQQMMEWIGSFWYVAVILPILGSGLTIWIHSVRNAIQRRDFASIATASYNSFAQIYNTVSAFRNLGGALGNVGELFGALGNSKGDGKGKLALVCLIIVIMALVGGFMIAFGLIKYFASKTQSCTEKYLEDNNFSPHRRGFA